MIVNKIYQRKQYQLYMELSEKKAKTAIKKKPSL